MKTKRLLSAIVLSGCKRLFCTSGFGRRDDLRSVSALLGLAPLAISETTLERHGLMMRRCLPKQKGGFAWQEV